MDMQQTVFIVDIVVAIVAAMALLSIVVGVVYADWRAGKYTAHQVKAYARLGLYMGLQAGLRHAADPARWAVTASYVGSIALVVVAASYGSYWTALVWAVGVAVGQGLMRVASARAHMARKAVEDQDGPDRVAEVEASLNRQIRTALGGA